MGKKILFSPIGNTDPIKYFHDGSMLHIARVYQPDEIYLYLTKEMLVHHDKDNRYVRTVELLGEKLNHQFTVHIIRNEKMVNAHEYDVFYDEFHAILSEIEKGMDKEDTLLVNMASGTPGMKSALVVMATLAEYRFLPIQVASPQRMSNLEFEERVEYDVETNWELDEDNKEEFQNRCKETICKNLMQMLKLDMIKKHVLAYDYHAAYEVAKELKDRVPDEALAILEAAVERVKLNQNRITQLDRKYYFSLFPVKEGSKQKIFEYALVLQLKLKREELADFLRGITPISDDLLEIIVENNCGIQLKDYCVLRKDALVWNQKKLENTQVGEILTKEFTNFRYDMVSSIHLKALIQNMSSDDIMKKKIASLVQVEQKVRNVAAHEIVSVTPEWIKERTGLKPQEIMDIIRFLCVKAGIGVKREDWDSYELMNDKIQERLLRSGS